MNSLDGICLVCGEPGHHFVSPSMGKFGYYQCMDQLTDQKLPAGGPYRFAAVRARRQPEPQA